MSTTPTGGAGPSDAGLQAERTGLAWSRTSVAVAGNAALLAVHDLSAARGAGGPLALVVAALATVLALVTAVHGRRRAASLRRAPLPDPLAARRAVPLFGAAVVVLAVLAVVAVVL